MGNNLAENDSNTQQRGTGSDTTTHSHNQVCRAQGQATVQGLDIRPRSNGQRTVGHDKAPEKRKQNAVIRTKGQEWELRGRRSTSRSHGGATSHATVGGQRRGTTPRPLPGHVIGDAAAMYAVGQVSREELDAAIERLKKGKAAGLDKITAEMIKKY